MTVETDPRLYGETLGGALDRVYSSLAEPGQAAGAGGAASGSSLPGDEAWRPFERLRAAFGLSQFEHDVLVLCTGFALESRFGARSAVTDDAGVACPTFGLALTVLSDPHWSAVTPSGPLRFWRLVEPGRGTLLDAPLHLAERILQFILGVPAIDERLQSLVRPLPRAALARPGRGEAIAVGSRHWTRMENPGVPLLLVGSQRSIRQSTFAAICDELGIEPYVLDASDIPAAAVDREHLARLWTREATLGGGALLLGTEHCDSIGPVSAWLEAVHAPVAVEVRPGTLAEQLEGHRLVLAPLSHDERRGLWSESLGPLAERLDGVLDRIAEYFDFDAPAIKLCAASVLETEAADADGDPGELCWRICREHGRTSLQTLAQRIEARAGWDDLVLPASQIETLRQIAVHMRRRAIVNDQWGFAAKHARGLGLTALFAGSSGTGKTMAAEVLAAEFALDLYRVDLASVVSKYIGETEKNLRAVFDGAERSGAVLLFDEADALFGKRSEVRDSHDRYANLEISYLLQRMEEYRGVAILTTNMQHALDPAFVRRLGFIVQFPFPDHEARAGIWRRIFPTATPRAELDFEQLAQLNVSGGVIRNIATNAAFLAAEDSNVVGPAHILAAARTEYAKLDKALTPAETRGFT
ncbi:MAG: ATP-binding protein [Actinomycetota bacterium]|nr:ATP-binding protein [Actinomycetota bacterium]